MRLASGVALGGLALTATLAGAPYFELLVGAFGAAMIWEWSRICAPAHLAAALAVGMATMAVAVALAHAGRFELALALTGLGAAASAAADRGRWAWHAMGVLYAGMPCLALLWMRGADERGLAIVLWVFAVVWATDSAAFLVGRAIDGPKLAPRISPGKTWAGLVGGAAAAALVSGVVGWLSHTTSPTLLAALGAGLAVVEQCGDLIESAFKRRFAVKDSSRLIPGHGGVLDRVDGLVAVVLAVAVLKLLLDDALIG